MSPKKPRKADLADLPPGALSPLDAAVTGRDRRTLDMVTAAVAHGDTMLAFQPVVLARDPGTVAFYEGLIRIFDPTGRVIPAREFIEVVEPTEIGREIDCASLEAGLKTLASVPDIRVSINMSARSIGYRRWTRILDRGLRNNPTAGERLILEITENSVNTVPELVAGFMLEVRAQGVAFALDDFGAGFTAVRQFRDLFFDAVKIDGQFARGIHASRDNQAVIAALVAMARQFEMFSVATFVEDGHAADVLRRIGVDCLQGHLHGAATVRPPWIADLQARRSA